jgi:hypothetical protein
LSPAILPRLAAHFFPYQADFNSLAGFFALPFDRPAITIYSFNTIPECRQHSDYTLCTVRSSSNCDDELKINAGDGDS